MKRRIFAWCIFLTLFPNYLTESDCPVNLKDHKFGSIYLNNLHLQEPKSSLTSTCRSGQTVDFTCDSGFLDNTLPGKSYPFKCNNGKYNTSYLFPDLLCRNEFHKNIRVEPVHAIKLNSKILKCDGQGLKLFEVRRVDQYGDKLLYRACFDGTGMRAKFSMKPATAGPTRWEKIRPVQRQDSRDTDLWGFDYFGRNAEERMSLSQIYVKKVQESRITKQFPKIDRGKVYPYYFNRGHLVAYRDFYDYEDQKGTLEYINAAPQWDILNEHSWPLVEKQSKEIVENNPLDWEIYTGTFGAIQTPTGPMNIGPQHNKHSKKLNVYVPKYFWKLLYNTKNRALSRAFVGDNNPENTYESGQNPVKLCPTPISFEGRSSKGFIYECPLEVFLQKLREVERIVK